MDRFEAGMLAWSRAGHDSGTLYVIMRTDEEYVYLTDGRLKPVDKPKKKKKKHVQVMRTIRRVIRRFANVESRCN